MCYPKPGPRCSAYAATKYLEARAELLAYFKDKRKGEDYEYSDFERLEKKVQQAKEEYQLTTAGIKELERLAKKDPHYEFMLEHRKSLRAERIEKVKENQRNNIQHKQKTVAIEYSNQDFSENGALLEALDDNSHDIKMMMEESKQWVHHLTDDEIVSLKWYSQDGYADINGYLATQHVGKRRTAEELNEHVSHIDSALDKSNQTRPVVVYRRHLFYTEEGSLAELSLEDIKQKFQPGSVFEPKFYMSTSLDPQNSPSKDGRVAYLQIKTRRGVSLAAVAAQATNEREFLLPRNAKYRVVSNEKKVTIKDHDMNTTLTVIQLEEI